MKPLYRYEAGVTDLTNAITFIEGVNKEFSQYRVPLREARQQLKKLESARDKREKSEAKEYV